MNRSNLMFPASHHQLLKAFASTVSAQVSATNRCGIGNVYKRRGACTSKMTAPINKHPTNNTAGSEILLSVGTRTQLERKAYPARGRLLTLRLIPHGACPGRAHVK